MWPSDHQTYTSSNDGPSPPSTNSLRPSFLSPPLRHHCVATLKGHTSYTSALALAGGHLFTGSSSGQIHRASLTSLSHHQTLPDEAMIAAGDGAVKALVASSDKLITAHQDHKIRVWRVDHAAGNHHQRITQLATLPTLSDRAIKLLLPRNHVRVRRHKTSTWVHHVDAVSALALSKDESLLYSVSWDRTLKIWRTADFKCLESVADAHDDAINAVALSGDGAVYTGSSDGKIKVWRRRQGEKGYSLDATLTKHKAGINALAMSADRVVLYSGASDALIRAWRSDGSSGMCRTLETK
ncbi:protein JINGUBANG-like isoform X1 [Salvia divinorum]|uniref:Protein JINGUBANG-like isoform X1 n=1 Tax=Salvia divinorum TaxID=28513 RepID=A0ABD1IEI1_SALDI